MLPSHRYPSLPHFMGRLWLSPYRHHDAFACRDQRSRQPLRAWPCGRQMAKRANLPCHGSTAAQSVGQRGQRLHRALILVTMRPLPTRQRVPATYNLVEGYLRSPGRPVPVVADRSSTAAEYCAHIARASAHRRVTRPRLRLVSRCWRSPPACRGASLQRGVRRKPICSPLVTTIERLQYLGQCF